MASDENDIPIPERSYPGQWGAVIAAINTSSHQINGRLDHISAEFSKLAESGQVTARTVGKLEERDAGPGFAVGNKLDLTIKKTGGSCVTSPALNCQADLAGLGPAF